VPDPSALVRLLASLRAGDVLFLDEVHAVPRVVQETLYEAMAEGSLSLTLHQGSRARALRLRLPPFTVVAATTEDGDLPDPLRTRFGLREHLGEYGVGDLARLAAAEAGRQGFALEDEAAERLAERARGVPREALRLVERILDGVASRGLVRVDRPAVDDALGRLGYDEDGLDPAERRYLGVLRESRAPVPLSRLAGILGMSVRTVFARLEPHLFRRGLVRVTPRGRMSGPSAVPRVA
jgi:Holliday junction DNA helicase RuvB